MNETKHTPGPWEIGALLGDPDGEGYEYPTIYRINEDGSTTYVADIMGAKSPQAWPNARLIAKAPTMKVALQAIRMAIQAQRKDGLDRTAHTEILINTALEGLD